MHFSNNNYTRALALLSRKDLIARSLSCRYLASHCYIKQGKYDQALTILGEENPTHLIDTAHNARRKLAHVNGGAGRHITQRVKGQRDRIEYSEERERDREQEKELKFQAGMCYLRGLCFAKRNAFDKARECYQAAVRIDVQCFEAFDQLMKNSLMSPAEELAFLEELDFDSIRADDPALAHQAADFTKLLYTTRLSKYASPLALAEATEQLSTHYNLSSNSDLLLTRAETLYTQCRFHDALAITTNILNSSASSGTLLDNSAASSTASLGHSPNLYPVHLAALYETGSQNTLFHLSHTLSVHAPHESYTYLAIGTYYLATNRISEARRFFSKASLMDPHSAPAWIGFAHTFAAEGEHDQAIAAYSTAARLFQGSHLPQLFLGMQHLALNNMQLAWEYCIAAFEMSSGSIKKGESRDLDTKIFNNPATLTGDPLVLNELGVILYHQSNLPAAARLFKKSLELAAELGCNMTAWVATRANLAHALRRLGYYDEALTEFDECLRIATGGSTPVTNSMFDPNKGMSSSFAALTLGSTTAPGPSGAANGYDERNLLGSIHTSRGLVLLSMQSRTKDAVIALHEAVRVLGGDAGGGGVAGTLLSRAMEIWGMEETDDDYDDEDMDEDDAGQEQYDYDDASEEDTEPKQYTPPLSRSDSNGNGNVLRSRRTRNHQVDLEMEPAHGYRSHPTEGVSTRTRTRLRTRLHSKKRSHTQEQMIESRLDHDADEILDAALSGA